MHGSNKGEPDVEVLDEELDPSKLLGTWLDELENLKTGLDHVGGNPGRPLSSPGLTVPRIDSYRFSMANLEESQDVDLDAILGELCALGNQVEAEIVKGLDGTSNSAKPYVNHARSASGSNHKFAIDLDCLSKTDMGPRTDSPDNDSAFSDNVSLLSSESSASSGTRTDVSKSSGASLTSSPTSAERLKAEKIRLALEKMREASIKKLYIKAFTQDGSTKSLMVDEKMSCGYVTRLLADKNHVMMEPRWSIVEHLPELMMERVYEDHELLVDNLMLWSRDSKNTILFLERPDKCDFFINPQTYLITEKSSEVGHSLDDDAKSNLLEEFFSKRSVPEVESNLYLKVEGKKVWKKYYFVLRASGIYYCPKGKSKSLKDLTCLATFEVNQTYFGLGWKKKFKAPTDFCFAIKHPHIQTSKGSKYIKYLCADDEVTVQRWVMGARLAKYGKQLLDNHRSLEHQLAEEDIDSLASARSVSIDCMNGGTLKNVQKSAPCPPTAVKHHEDDDMGSESSNSGHPTPVNTLDRTMCLRPVLRQDSVRSKDSGSSSSGCLSETSSSGTPTYEHGFECDFPSGTIKRKPAMNPKLPLTSTTRLIVKEVDDKTDPSHTLLRQSLRKSLNLSGGVRKEPIPVPEDSNPNMYTSSEYECFTDADNLPPPPPEMFDSIISIESLPPPPPPPDPMSDSMISCASLPPPPPELLQHPPPPPPPHNLVSVTPDPVYSYGSTHSVDVSNGVVPINVGKVTADASDSAYSTVKRQLEKALPNNEFLLRRISGNEYGTVRRSLNYGSSARKISDSECAYINTPPYLAELKAQANGSPTSIRKSVLYSSLRKCSVTSKDSITSQNQDECSKKGRKISFADTTPRPKPPPPKRSSSTCLSASPQRLGSPSSSVTPPKEFLNDLQRVMQKKWQVAQKLKTEGLESPHEVLGFRELPEEGCDANLNVTNWLENHCWNSKSSNRFSFQKKRPPPLPPRRSETTQLSSSRDTWSS